MLKPCNTSMEAYRFHFNEKTPAYFQINWLSSCCPLLSPSWPPAPESWWLKLVGLANINFPSKYYHFSHLWIFQSQHTTFADMMPLPPYLWSTVLSTWVLLLDSLPLVSKATYSRFPSNSAISYCSIHDQPLQPHQHLRDLREEVEEPIAPCLVLEPFSQFVNKSDLFRFLNIIDTS